MSQNRIAFNPELIRQVESLLTSIGKPHGNNEIEIPSWQTHKKDFPNGPVHAVYYRDSKSAWEFSHSEFYGLKHLAAWLKIDLDRIGGLYEDGSLPKKGFNYEANLFGKYERQEPDPLPISDGQIDQWTWELQDNKWVLDWLNKRGINEFWAVNFRLGFDRNRLVIPWFDMENRLMAIKYRSFKPDAPKKYYSEKKSSYTELLYNMRTMRHSDIVLKTETELDAIALRSLVPHLPVIAKPANGFNQWNAEYFWSRQLYDVLDNDEAGKENAKKIKSLVGSARFLSTSLLHKDLGECIIHGILPDWLDHFMI